MEHVLDQDLEQSRRQQVLDGTTAAYTDLWSNLTAWAKLREELAEWDGTLNDGLEGV